MNLENKEIKTRCRNLSYRNLILETENTDLKFSQKMFWTNQNAEELDSFLTKKRIGDSE